jgi:hypothetical protein
MGLLIDQSVIDLRRKAFKRAAEQKGIEVEFYEAKEHNYNNYNEFDQTKFKPPVKTNVLFYAYLNQYTVKKMSWANEVDAEHPIVEGEWDLPLQVGAVFKLPSAIGDGDGKVYRVATLANTPLYPISFKCQLAPIFKGEEIQDAAYEGKKELFVDVTISEGDD